MLRSLHTQQGGIMKLVNFDDVPLGGKIKYQWDELGSPYVVIRKYRVNDDTEPMSGTLVRYTGEIGVRQSLVSHIAGEGGCDEEVIFLG